jgi:hypothetical protein
MSSVAYLDVTFNKNLTLKEGSLQDLITRFIITVGETGSPFNPTSIEIIKNKVRLGINNNQVPQPNENIKIEYKQSVANLSDEVGSLVDSNTGYSLNKLTTTRRQNLEYTAGTIGSTRPIITSAIVEHESPTNIVIKFTPGRDVSNNSILGSNTTPASQTGESGYGITPIVLGITSGANSNATWIDGSNNTTFIENQVLVLKTGKGEIQYGMELTLDISGFNIADQFDLSMNNNGETTNKPVTNNVKQLNVDNAYISNIDPSSIIIYFKAGDVSGVNMDNIILSNTILPPNIYKVKMEDISNNIIDISSINFTENECKDRDIPYKYAGVKGIKFFGISGETYPFKYNKGVSVYWDNESITDNKRIKDQFGNEIFPSEFDPLNDDKFIPVTNNIKGIKIKPGPSYLDINGGGVGDLSYNVILQFCTSESSSTDIITGSLVNAINTDFSFNVITTTGVEKSFNPDYIKEVSNPPGVELFIDYSKNTFYKMITQGDTVKLSYTNSSWPSSIKDQYGNFVLPQTDISVNNILDGSGNIRNNGVFIRKNGNDYNEIDISYNVDICLNYIDGSNNIYNNDLSGGFILNVDEPVGVIIDKIVKLDSSNATLILNKGLYATSVPILTYNNSKSVIRNVWGPKLKNNTSTLTNQLVEAIKSIEAPREVFLYNSGKINEFGIIDISFTEHILDLGEGRGFKYSAGYSNSIPDLSTNGFIDISPSNIELVDGVIRLHTTFNGSGDIGVSGGIRGFSRKHTEGSPYYISVKYVHPSNYPNSDRPSGVTGYLPNFTGISMADISNSIMDPSCNLQPSPDKQTAIIPHEYPSVVYIAIKQPVYHNDDIILYDISGINLIENLYNNQFNYLKHGISDISSINVSIETGLDIGGHSLETKWLRVKFPVDLSRNDISLNYIDINGIRDQNGGILKTFTNLDICSNVIWCDVSGSGDINNDGSLFETGYPFIHGDDGKTIYCRWDPNFTDFEGTSIRSYNLARGDQLYRCVSQSGEQLPDGENVLKLTFDTNMYDISHTLIYKKPPGRAGLRLGLEKKWVRDFSNSVIEYRAPTMTITATNSIGEPITSNGDATNDLSINLIFTTDIGSSNFSIGDISSSTGIIGPLTETNVNYIWTSVFTPYTNENENCIIEVLDGKYNSMFKYGERTNINSSPFIWNRGIN